MVVEVLEKKIVDVIERVSAVAADEGGGVTRLLYSKEWFDTQMEIKKIMSEEGLEADFDSVGNLYGTLSGGELKSELIATGSHCDTVKNGGKYDGMYGIVSGILALSYLKSKYGTPKRTIKVVSFAEEEGSRFPLVFWGSMNFIGKADLSGIRGIRDENGTSFKNAMEKCGFVADEGFHSDHVLDEYSLKAFIEAHVEQGFVLEKEKKEIGIVTGIVGQKRLNVFVRGTANHAGTTPMKYRQDALSAASIMISKLTLMAREEGPPLVATAGHIRVSPNVSNVIAGEAEFSIDIRHTSKEVLQNFTERVCNMVVATAEEENVDTKIEFYMDKNPVPMDRNIVKCIRQACVDLDISYMPMHSGAGHDSQVVGELFPTGMIFVPSRDGISHNPSEYTSPKEMANGTKVLINTLYQLGYK